MATIRSTIVSDIVSACGAIKIADGFGTDVATDAGGGGAFYWMGADLTTVTYPFVVVAALSETELQRNLYQQMCQLIVTVEAFGQADGGTDAARWEYMDQLAADVHKALLADRTRDGNAVDTFIDSLDIKPHSEIDGLLVATTSVRVHYRHAFGDPSTAGPTGP